MVARILALLLATFYLLLATPVLAQDSTPSSTSKESGVSQASLPAYIPPTSPLYTDLLVNNLFHSFSCLAIGQSLIGQPCLTYQFTKNAQGMLQGVPMLSQTNLSGGTLGGVASLIAVLYSNPPVRSADYIASVSKGFGLVKEVKAQGVTGSGAEVLNPILNLWQVSRNIAYIFMIIAFLVIGIMIMFRNKINPQTVITAQAALPGLIIGLIMITFSYFFAGLISDLAFIGTNVVGYYFQAAQGIPNIEADLVQKTKDESVLNIFSRFVGVLNRDDATRAVDTIFNNFTGEVQTYLRIFAGIVAFQFGNQLGGAVPYYGVLIAPIIGIISASTIQFGISPVLGFVISLFTVAILIITMLKLLLRLVNNYITILFLTLSAPFQFMAASLPGRQGIATSWFLNMLCNVLAFPAVMAVFYFVNYLLGATAVINSPFSVQAQPSIAGTNTFPLFGGLDVSILRVVVAIGALIATPAIPDLICRAIGVTGQAGQLIGQQISGGIGAGRGYTGQAAQRGFGAAQSIGTGIGGESGWAYDPGTRKPVRIPSKAGWWQIFRP